MPTAHDDPPTPVPGTDAGAGAAGPVTLLIDPMVGDDVESEERARRRKKRLLLLLCVLASLFLVIAGWYLLTRKPLPLPGLVTEDVPTFRGVINTPAEPIGVAVSGDGELLYVTYADGRTPAQALDRSGEVVATLTPPADTGAAHMPAYLAVHPDTGEVYVTDRITSQIYVYDRAGDYVSTFPAPGDIAGSWAPLAITIDAAGQVYVSDVSGSQVIRQFAPDGTQLRTFGAPGGTSFVNGLAVDDNGTLIAADSNNGRVVFFDPQGRQLAQINGGAGTGELGMPRGLALAGDERVYVVDTVNHLVSAYTVADPAQGARFIGTMGQEGIGEGAFEFPNGAATDDRDRVYVADRLNRRIQMWSR
jgi:DNA-binding beta-propeller fold protein YncE